MASDRERELARKKAVRQAQRQQEQQAAQRRLRIIIGAVLAAGLLIAGIAFLTRSSSDDTPPDDVAASTPGDPTNVTCNDPGELQTEAKQFPDGPEGIVLAKDAVLGLQIKTNCGDMELEFDKDRAPKNTTAMIFLANTGAPQFEEPGNNKSEVIEVQGYFDNTACHRLTTAGIFVLQCGDPTGTGTGNPGFTTPDENTDAGFEEGENGTVIYPRGTVAMANSGPDTNGSQFFIVYKDSPLPPDYSVIGRLSKGLEIVDKVAEFGVDGGGNDGRPAETIALTKVLSFERREVAQ